MTIDLSLETIKSLYKEDRDKIIEEYKAFLSIPSISSEAKHRKDMDECVLWLNDYLNIPQLKVENWKTEGFPVIFAEYDKAGPDKPTLLFYGHYDVQPIDPIELWTSPPFSPEIRDDRVFARGAEDNKGQCFYTMAAIKHFLQAGGELPVNVKIIIEGEEEIGSPSLGKVLIEKKDKLKSDYLFIVDLGFMTPDQVAVSIGTRGIATMSVKFTGSSTDLHSGSHGGVAYNPLHALIDALSSMKDDKGTVLIEGFYDNVREVSDEEKSRLSMDFDEEEYTKAFGAIPAGGEEGLTPIESNWFRPSLEVNGIAGGYYGDGFKTVIPKEAVAKISVRTVEGQDPKRLQNLIADHLKKHTHPAIQVESTIHAGTGSAVKTPIDAEVLQISKKAYEEVTEMECRFILQGATIPIVPELVEASGAHAALIGFGLPTDNIHAPNENFSLSQFERGFLSTLRIVDLAAGK